MHVGTKAFLPVSTAFLKYTSKVDREGLSDEDYIFDSILTACREENVELCFIGSRVQIPFR